MNLFKSLVQAKDKCILDDSLFYDTIGHSDSLEELVCEKTFFFLLVSSGKAKLYSSSFQIIDNEYMRSFLLGDRKSVV